MSVRRIRVAATPLGRHKDNTWQWRGNAIISLDAGPGIRYTVYIFHEDSGMILNTSWLYWRWQTTTGRPLALEVSG